MPATHKPIAIEPIPESLMMIVGQLLEATKVASEGIKSLSNEVRANATAILVAVKTLEMVEETVGQLNDLVRGDPQSLVRKTDRIDQLTADLQKGLADLRAAMTQIHGQVQNLDQHKAKVTDYGTMILYVILAISWLVNTAIAVWAATKSK